MSGEDAEYAASSLFSDNTSHANKRREQRRGTILGVHTHAACPREWRCTDAFAG